MKIKRFNFNFVTFQFKTFDENFSKPAQITESERSRDAWIIPESARKILSSPPGSYLHTRDMLTMPGVILEEELVQKALYCKGSL